MAVSEAHRGPHPSGQGGDARRYHYCDRCLGRVRRRPNMFLETLLKLAPDLPFKIFLTSRPEPGIRQKMLESGRSRSVLHLHDIEESVVEADIKKYLTDAFHTMSPRPSSYQVEQLANRAGRLFIYAATAVRYIHPDSRAVVNSAARLERVLSLTTGSGKQHEELDKLYTSVLSAAFNNDLEED